VFKWMLRYFQGEMIRLEVLESYTLVLHMLGFWEKVGKGRRGWWGAGRKNGGGGGGSRMFGRKERNRSGVVLLVPGCGLDGWRD